MSDDDIVARLVAELEPQFSPSFSEHHGVRQMTVNSSADPVIGMIDSYARKIDTSNNVSTWEIPTRSQRITQLMLYGAKIAAVIARLKSNFKQDLLLHHAASIMQIPFESIKGLMQQQSNTMNQRSETLPGNTDSQGKTLDDSKGENDIIVLEEKILSAILQSMAIMALVRIPDEMRACFSPSMQTILEALAHYEQQTEEEAVAEDEAAFEDETQTVMEIPNELVPVVRELIAKHQA